MSRSRWCVRACRSLHGMDWKPRLEKNFLIDSASCFEDSSASGPWRRSIGFELPPMLWTGTVEVDGRRVIYRDLRSLDGFEMDVTFDIDANGFAMCVKQRSDADRLFLEAEACALCGTGRTSIRFQRLRGRSAARHRNGIVEPRGAFHCTGQGSLSFRPLDDDNAAAPVGMQIETSGFMGRRQAFAGLLVGVRPEAFGPVTLLKGTHRASMQFDVTNVEPELTGESSREKVHRGLRRAGDRSSRSGPSTAGSPTTPSA